MPKVIDKKQTRQSVDTRPATETKKNGVPLHCLRDARCRKKISKETVASHLGIDVALVELLENESTDIPLSLLHEWKKLLDVPFGELLIDEEGLMYDTRYIQDQLDSMLKTALKIAQQSKHGPVKHMVNNLIDQLLQIMPELHEVLLQNNSKKPSLLEEYLNEFKLGSFEEGPMDYAE